MDYEQIDLLKYLEVQREKEIAAVSLKGRMVLAWSRVKKVALHSFSRFQDVRKGFAGAIKSSRKKVFKNARLLGNLGKVAIGAFWATASLKVKKTCIPLSRYVIRDLQMHKNELRTALRTLSEPVGRQAPSRSESTISISTLLGLAPWVNVYTVTRSFGGSDHGGWYYRRYTCEKSIQVWRWDAEATAAKLMSTYRNLAWGLLCAEAAGQEVTVRIESRKAGLQSDLRPEYHPSLVVKSALDTPGLEKPSLVFSSPLKPKSSPKSVSRRTSSKTNHLHLVRTARLDKEPCGRCKGTGRTRYTHIQGGICFLCGGTGEKKEDLEDQGEDLHSCQ